MSKEFENNDPIRNGRRRFIGAGAGLLGMAWATQASAGWRFICDRPRPCFLEGTRIETETGLVPVEMLKAGDRVRTLDGTFKPIRWVGSSTVTKAHAGDWPRNDAPILIRKDALGDGAPRTDLRVSAQHAFYFDGVLVKVKDLVNGLTIIRDTAFAANELHYYHVELEAHDVIFAEGAAAETFRAHRDNRSLFDKGSGVGQLARETAPFAPILTLSRKTKAVVQLKSAIMPGRNHAGRIGEINRMIIARAEAGMTGRRAA